MENIGDCSKSSFQKGYVSIASGTSCTHKYPAGSGGKAGGCITLCAPAKDGYIEGSIKKACDVEPSSKDGIITQISSNSAYDIKKHIYKYNKNLKLTNGLSGQTCNATLFTKSKKYYAYTTAGTGGKNYVIKDLASNSVDRKIQLENYFKGKYDGPLALGVHLENISKTINTGDGLICNSTLGTKACGSKRDGVNGADGVVRSNLNNNKGCEDPNIINTIGRNVSNNLYVWTMPYAYNVLAYGNTGKAGSYAKNTIPKVNGAITITLGKGATSPTGSGSATTVTMGGSNVVTAHGGGGGSSDSKTNKYDLCFAGHDNRGAKSCGACGVCCAREMNSKTTKGMSIQKVVKSSFDSAMAKSSGIIGLGLGRGGVGYNTVAGCEEVSGIARFDNVSYLNNGTPEIKNLYNSGNIDSSCKASPNNVVLKPSNLELRGGDGAVILVW